MSRSYPAPLIFILVASAPALAAAQTGVDTSTTGALAPSAVTATSAAPTPTAPATVAAPPAPAIASKQAPPAPAIASKKAGTAPDAAESLVPEGEAERMADHPVDTAKIRFRPGKGLYLESADGAFGLATRVRGQVRYTAIPGEAGAAGEADTPSSHELQLRRVRIVFSGHLFTKQAKYKLELAVSPNDTGISDNFSDDPLDNRPLRTPLLDLYFDFLVHRDVGIRVGQYKLPSNRQRVISSGNLQLVDRSIMNSEFTLDRDVGFDLRSRDLFGLDMLSYYAGVSIGRGRDSKGFDDFGLNYFLRVELLPFGQFSDYSEADFARKRKPRLSVGAVYVFQDRNRGLRRIASGMPADGGTTDYHIAMADFIFKYAGLTAQAEFAYRTGERNPGDAVDDMGNPISIAPPRNGWGGMLQAGYLIPRWPLEVAARVGAVRGVGDATETGLGDLNEVGGGISWYFARHPYKIQADVFRLFSDGWSDGETQIRVQLQAGL